MEGKRARNIGGALVGALALAGAAFGATSAAAHNGGAEQASAVLQDAGGKTVGFARFTEDASGTVHVNIKVSGLSEGLHGTHVHGIGSCTSGASTFSGAGSHHNPPPAQPHGDHAGDLPNMTVNGAGRCRLNTNGAGFTLSAGATTIFDTDGSALVVHADTDDYMTDPTGNSGGRVVCGIIRAG